MTLSGIGPRLTGARTAVRGRLAAYLRELLDARGLTDAALLAAGASLNQANLSAYLNGKRFPDPRCFIDLIDAFRNAGAGLCYLEIKAAEFLYMDEARAWDRYTSEESG